MKTLLVVDDESSVRLSLRAVFETEYRVICAANGNEALARLEEESPDAAIVDLLMPGMSGLDLLPRLKQADPHLGIIVLSAVHEIPKVVEAVRLGASHYLTKPFDTKEIRLIVELILKASRRSAEITVLESEMARWYDVGEIVGRAKVWKQVLAMIKRAAESADTTIMLSGESGTGKELLARLAHNLSPRRENPMIPIHCAAIPQTLIESELFGHERGSFTGATERRRGCVELADGGTLFLDEIGEMPLNMQSKLLRFLQDHQYMRVGGQSVRHSDVRVIGATNRDLKQGIAQGWFREDLYYRLNVVPIVVPNLRDREGDVPLLVNHFLGHFRAECGGHMAAVSPEAMAILEAHDWPGNVRELRNLVERIMVLHGDHEVLLPDFLPSLVKQTESIVSSAPGYAFPLSIEAKVSELERELILRAMEEAAGNLSRAAVLLQTTRRILKYKVDRYGLD